MAPKRKKEPAQQTLEEVTDEPVVKKRSKKGALSEPKVTTESSDGERQVFQGMPYMGLSVHAVRLSVTGLNVSLSRYVFSTDILVSCHLLCCNTVFF